MLDSAALELVLSTVSANRAEFDGGGLYSIGIGEGVSLDHEGAVAKALSTSLPFLEGEPSLSLSRLTPS